jgi:hypothetical protein
MPGDRGTNVGGIPVERGKEPPAALELTDARRKLLRLMAEGSPSGPRLPGEEGRAPETLDEDVPRKGEADSDGS